MSGDFLLLEHEQALLLWLWGDHRRRVDLVRGKWRRIDEDETGLGEADDAFQGLRRHELVGRAFDGKIFRYRPGYMLEPRGQVLAFRLATSVGARREVLARHIAPALRRKPAP